MLNGILCPFRSNLKYFRVGFAAVLIASLVVGALYCVLVLAPNWMCGTGESSLLQTIIGAFIFVLVTFIGAYITGALGVVITTLIDFMDVDSEKESDTSRS